MNIVGFYVVLLNKEADRSLSHAQLELFLYCILDSVDMLLIFRHCKSSLEYL